MRLLKHGDKTGNIVGYVAGIASYGRVKLYGSPAKYRIELNIFKNAIKFYKSTKKPLIRNLYLWSVLLSPIWLLIHAIFLVVFAVWYFIQYPYETLVQKTYLNETMSYITGWLWIAFALYGMYSLIF